jgi:hypothetical protein
MTRLRRHPFSILEALIYVAIFGAFASMVGKLFHQATLTQRHHLAAAWGNHQAHRIRQLWQQHVHAATPDSPATATLDGRDLIITSPAGSHRLQLPTDSRVTTHIESPDGPPLAVLHIQITLPYYNKKKTSHYRFLAAIPQPPEAPHAP